MLTIPEAAIRLGVARSTLYAQIHLGKLRAEKWGRDWMVTPEEVERYREQHLRQPTAFGLPSDLAYGYPTTLSGDTTQEEPRS